MAHRRLSRSRRPRPEGKRHQGRKPRGDHDNGGEPEGDYEVGYGKPPQHTRWKPGCRSPNPAGRPKRSRNFATILKVVIEQPIDVKEGQRVRRMSRGEALVRHLVNRAFSGDQRALGGVLYLLKQYGPVVDAESQSDELALGADPRDIIEDYLRRYKPGPDKKLTKGN